MSIRVTQYQPDGQPYTTMVEGSYMEASEDSRMVAVFKDADSAADGPLAIFSMKPGDRAEKLKDDSDGE